MKIFRNKLFIGLLCILIGVLVAFFAIPGVIDRETETAEIYTAATKIDAGAFITEAHLTKVEVPVRLAPSDKLDPAQAVGKRALSVIYAGDTITADKVTDTYVPLDTYSIATEKGKMVMSISARNLPASVAARIKPGDVVSVLALPLSRVSQVPSGLTPVQSQQPVQTEDDVEVEENEQGEMIAEETETQLTPATQKPQTIQYPELQYMEVAAVVANTGANASVKEQPGAEESNVLPTTISFYVSQDQALRLAELERNGNAYIVFVARGESAYEFIPEAEKVLVLASIDY